MPVVTKSNTPNKIAYTSRLGSAANLEGESPLPKRMALASGDSEDSVKIEQIEVEMNIPLADSMGTVTLAPVKMEAIKVEQNEVEMNIPLTDSMGTVTLAPVKMEAIKVEVGNLSPSSALVFHTLAEEDSRMAVASSDSVDVINSVKIEKTEVEMNMPLVANSMAPIKVEAVDNPERASRDTADFESSSAITVGVKHEAAPQDNDNEHLPEPNNLTDSAGQEAENPMSDAAEPDNDFEDLETEVGLAIARYSASKAELAERVLDEPTLAVLNLACAFARLATELSNDKRALVMRVAALQNETLQSLAQAIAVAKEASTLMDEKWALTRENASLRNALGASLPGDLANAGSSFFNSDHFRSSSDENPEL